jgi:hypothetical protein
MDPGRKDVGLFNQRGIRLRMVLLHLLHDIVEADDSTGHATPERSVLEKSIIRL